jgi:truncated hemoglobin YjbI
MLPRRHMPQDLRKNNAKVWLKLLNNGVSKEIKQFFQDVVEDISLHNFEASNFQHFFLVVI